MKVPMKLTGAGVILARAENRKIRSGGQILVVLLALALAFATLPQALSAYQDAQQQDSQQQSGDPSQQGAQQQEQGQGQAYTQQTPEQLQQLVAPIALYPDSLVAQILAATTFPAEIVEADRWVQAHPDLKGDALAQAVDQQPWDPSVKALTAFPSVLGNMDKNISWTSSLGDAYYNQQQDVMDAVQVMRQKAQAAGNLKSTEQQNVQTQGSTIVIQPANPEVVYVPAYDPWAVYGYPVAAWPGWYPYPGIWFGGPYLSFGVGFGIGWYGGYGWGWGHWGPDWHNHYIVYNHNRYYSNSRTFYNRNVYYGHGGDRGVTSNPRNSFNNERGHDNRTTETRGNEANRGRENTLAPSNVYNRPGDSPRPFEGNRNDARGFGGSQQREDTRSSSAFGGYDHGGESRAYSSRGQSSFGGGGGGFHGGGGGGGGGRGGGGGHR
jgi:uncharacterized membrane protein YgcG